MNYLLGTSIGIGVAAILLLPSALGQIRHAQASRAISALTALAALTLVCGVKFPWFLLATGVLWGWGMVLAAASPRRSAQPASANSGRATSAGDPGASEGPPSVS